MSVDTPAGTVHYAEVERLPSAHDLAAINEIVPGFAERFVDSFLEEGDHRRDMDRRDMAMREADAKSTRDRLAVSAFGAFAIAIATAAAIIILSVAGLYWGAAALGVGLSTSGTVFLALKLRSPKKADVG